MNEIKCNKIKCLKCGDIIESNTEHDFKFCKCGSCGVDGGHDYLRRVGYKENWEDLSIIEVGKRILEEHKDAFDKLGK